MPKTPSHPWNPPRQSPRKHPKSAEDVASCCECTGLLPGMPATEEGTENTLGLYGVPAKERDDSKF